MTVEQKLRGEVLDVYERLGELDITSDEYAKAVASANSIVDRLNEGERIKIEQEKAKDEKRDRLIKNIITGAAFVITTGVTIWANVDSKKFERTDTHTTDAGKASTRRLLNFNDKWRLF